MEARLVRAALLAASVLSLGAGYRTQNFVVTAPTPQFSQEVALAAESYRKSLAIEWLGRELPAWQDPCPIMVSVGPQLGAGGATSFMFEKGHPFGWSMNIQGSQERLLDSVLPHEVTHTIMATHFGRPLPRWADEGACTTVEHVSEKAKQHNLLLNFLTSGRGIAFNQMFAMTEYPPDVLPLYAQGYSLARFLIAQRGKPAFVNYVGDGMQSNNWGRATLDHYGYKDLSELQITWLDWVRRGSPSIAAPNTMLAQQTPPASQAAPQAAVAGDGLVPVHIPGAPSAASRGAVAQAAVPQSAAVAQTAASPTAIAPTAIAQVGAASGRPAGNLASLNSGGWYSRIKDKTVAGHGQGAVLVSAPPEAAQTLSHAQSIERPQPTVLEWTHSSPSASLAPAPAGTILR
jgi:hypothetical protein